MPNINLYPEVKKKLDKFKEENYCSTFSDSVNLLLEKAGMYNLTASISSQLDKFAEILKINNENPKIEIKKENMDNLEPDIEIDIPNFDNEDLE